MDNIEQDTEQAMGGGGNNIGGNMEQDAMKDMSGGGGGGGMDKTINSAVDNFASSEGIPGAADGMINKDVDAEVNKLI
ncbi:hypothetical protein ABVK25_005151 [Lepraria finkii]|uniref:Uncharacterized protein n=1 Tax=Lepraria finkii TaxID=1340010 RepID=A0ABR4B960_9LECA